ncbi:hypothetical protein Taro_044774 [Colocasia esculenta]|uniref:Uncharacterized protein n=1 Tax=Colocasia esculenta TaxID=4460 RepID=A0A843WK46_COLES|nr:hypothetical protein [Colocasia esculenta]
MWEQGKIVEEAPIQGEQGIEKEAASQGAHTEDAPVNEGYNEIPIEVEEQVERRSLTKKIAHRRQKKFLKKVHLKPILKRLDDQGEVLTSVQSAMSYVIVRQESMSNDISHINNAMKWFNKELSSMKVMVSKFLKAVGPKDPTPQECEPSGQSEGNAGPSGPIDFDLVELPSGPSVDAPAGPSGQKEIKFIRKYQMYSNYCYVNRLPESQLGQFRAAIRALSSSTAHTDSLQVDFATLVIPDVVFLPPLHALIMDSSVGTLIFERAARVMARLFVQDGRDLSFPRFVFKQYLQGHIKADVLAPILSECDRLSPADWTKLYPLSAQQLEDLNASQASSNQPPLTPGEFLDANSLHLIWDSYLTWVERYKVFSTLKKELRSHQIDYPLKIDAFLRFASFGSFLSYKITLGSAKYGDFISDQRQLHIKRMGVVFPSVVKEDLVGIQGVVVPFV